MTTGKIIIWIASVIVAWVAVFLFSRFFMKHEKKSWLAIIAAVLELLLAIIFAFIAIAINTWRIWHFNMAMLALYVALVSFAVANIIYFVVSIYREKKRQKADAKIKIHSAAVADDVGIATDSAAVEPDAKLATDSATAADVKIKTHSAAVIAALMLALGTINMLTIVPNKHTYTSDKLTGNHCFVVISDLHVGSAQSDKTIDKMLAEVKALDPEFFVLNGDITDEFTKKETMQAIYSKVGQLGIPTYFIYGNHDRQENATLAFGAQYTVKELEAAITGSGITILKDEVANIGDDISILGREDASNQARLPVGELPPRAADRYQITFDHQPYNTEDIIETGAALQVSGHSHAGQYFPLEQLYDLLGFDAYGEYQRGDTILLTSSGASGWSVPFRTSRRCNYDVIYLQRD